ncbi:MAG: hypothetical protein JST92_24130 [Deltaproteobacteria bacterium]|nr:hypothetical protein [Deltaproteobacteria bacterium]
MPMGRIRFCRGLPQTGERPLTDGERALLTAEVARAASRVRVYWALVACAPLLGLGSAVLAIALRLDFRSREEVVVLGFTASLFALVVIVKHLRDQRRRVRDLPLELESGTVLEFGSEPSTLILEKSLRVLGTSIGEPVEVRMCAPSPADAPLSALPDELRGSRPIGVLRRRLSEDEREELVEHVARARASALPVPIAITAMVMAGLGEARLIVIAVGWRSTRLASWQLMAQAVLWLLIFLATYWRFKAERRLRSGLRKDHEEGWVLRATEGPGAGDEGLPNGGVAWMDRGEPSSWRTDKPVKATQAE